MYSQKRKWVCVVVVVLVLAGSPGAGAGPGAQGDEPPAPRPTLPVVNGHTASSVAMPDEQMKLEGPTGFINDPTGAPGRVPTAEPGGAGHDSPAGSAWAAGGPPHGADGFTNGPTGTSVQVGEHRFDRIAGLVNGPTGISVEAEEEQRSDGVTDLGDDPTGVPVETEQRSDGVTDLGDDPTGVPVETGQRSDGVTDLGDDPTGVPVETEQRSDGVMGYANGPTSTVAEAEEQVGSEGVARLVNHPPGIAIPGEELGSDGVSGFVNGPTGISVETEEEQRSSGVGGFVEGPAEGSVGAEEKLSRSSSRGVLSTALQDELLTEQQQQQQQQQRQQQQRPPGLHIDTADWSKDSAHYSFKGGEWSLVDLPDPAHPAIPAPVLPGYALVVVTHKYLKKVYVQREVRGLANITLHYRFFLTEGEAPHGVPELKVYQVVDSQPQLLATETTRGAWADRTVQLTHPGPSTIIFEGRLNKKGNEIAIDDITISGISDGGGDGRPSDTAPSPSDAAQAPPPNPAHAPPPDPAHAPPPDPAHAPGINTEEGPTIVPTGIEVLQDGNETLDNLEGRQQGAPVAGDQLALEVNQETLPQVTDNPEAVGELEDKNLTEIPADVELVPPSRGAEAAEGGAQSPDNMRAAAAPVHIPGPVDRENETAALTSMPDATVLSEENGTGVPPSTTDVWPDGEENHTPVPITDSDMGNGDVPTTDSDMVNGENETVISFTTVGELVSQGNNTDGLLETTLSFPGTRAPEDNTSLIPDPWPSTDHRRPGQTATPDNTTLPATGEPLNPGNFTESPTFPQISDEVSQGTSTPPEGGGAPGGVPEAPGTQQASHPAVSPTIVTFSSASPSESMTTTAPGASETMPVARTPWGVFQVFLVLCLLGSVVLAFLYWRKKRRQDDEIPVFTRSSHADYHNPTFTPDDDSSFASYGARHNYKSFE